MTMTTTTERAPSFGYDDLRHLMSMQTGDEKHDASSTSTLDNDGEPISAG